MLLLLMPFKLFFLLWHATKIFMKIVDVGAGPRLFLISDFKLLSNVLENLSSTANLDLKLIFQVSGALYEALYKVYFESAVSQKFPSVLLVLDIWFLPPLVPSKQDETKKQIFGTIVAKN